MQWKIASRASRPVGPAPRAPRASRTDTRRPARRSTGGASCAQTARVECRAGDGARTRDIKLGRLALYQLSYSREAWRAGHGWIVTGSPASAPHRRNTRRPATGRAATGRRNGGGRIRTFEGRSRQIYSLLPLTAWLLHRRPAPIGRADGENRTRNRPITNRVLCQLSYVSRAGRSEHAKFAGPARRVKLATPGERRNGRAVPTAAPPISRASRSSPARRPRAPRRAR